MLKQTLMTSWKISSRSITRMHLDVVPNANGLGQHGLEHWTCQSHMLRSQIFWLLFYYRTYLLDYDRGRVDAIRTTRSILFGPPTKLKSLACLLTRDCTRTTTTRTQGCKWVSAESTFSVSSLYISSRSVVCWKQVRFFRASKDVPNDPTTCVKYTLVLPTLICDKMGSCGGRQKIVHKMSSRISQRLNYKVSTKLMLIY